MIKQLLLFILCTPFLAAFSQTAETEARILEVYPVEKVAWLKANNPERLQNLVDVLENSYELIEVTSALLPKIANMKKVDIVDLDEINVLLFASAPLANSPQYFYAESHDVIIRIKTKEEFEADKSSVREKK